MRLAFDENERFHNLDKLTHLLGRLIRGVLIVFAALIALCLIAVVVLQVWQPDLSGSWVDCNALTDSYSPRSLEPFPVNTLEMKQTYSLDIDIEAAQSVALSPDLRFVGLTHLGSVTVWDIQSGELFTQLSVEAEEVHPLAWSPDSKYLAYGVSGYQRPHELGQLRTAQWDNRVLVRNLEAEEQVLVVEGSSGSIDDFDFINSIYFTPDSKLLIAESGDGFYVWDMEIGEQLCNFHQNSIFWDTHTEEMLLSLGWRADASPLIASQVIGRGIPTNATSVWGINDWINLRIDTGEDRFVGAIWSANSNFLALISSGAAYGVSPDRITVWTVPEGEMLMSLNENYTFLNWSPDEQNILVENGPNIEVWNVLTAERVAQAETGESLIVDSRWSPDGSTIAILFKDGTVQFWSVE